MDSEDQDPKRRERFQLEAEGIAAFMASYDELIAGVEQKRAGLSA